MTKRQKIVVLLMNIFIFIELTYSIIQGKKDFENMTSIFFQNFIPLFLITYISCKILVRRLEPVKIPGQSDRQAVNPFIEMNYDNRNQ